MAKVGYIYRSDADERYQACIDWMQEYGCVQIYEESPEFEKTRVQWKHLLDLLQRGDELVLAKFSNALRKTQELSALVDFCRMKVVRLISIEDRIDSEGKLFPKTTAADVLSMIGSMPYEAATLRNQAAHIEVLRKSARNKKVKVLSKSDREMQIVNMYKSGYSIEDIWVASGFKSRSSVFRVLNKFNVELNRGKFSGPLGPRKKKEEQE